MDNCRWTGLCDALWEQGGQGLGGVMQAPVKLILYYYVVLFIKNAGLHPSATDACMKSERLYLQTGDSDSSVMTVSHFCNNCTRKHI